MIASEEGRSYHKVKLERDSAGQSRWQWDGMTASASDAQGFDKRISQAKEDLLSVYSVHEISFMGIIVSCVLSAFGLVATVLYINMNFHYQTSLDTRDGVISLHTQRRYRNALIGASTGCIVVFIVLTVFEVLYLRRFSMALEGNVCRLCDVFDFLLKLDLESVPLYLNALTDTKSINEKQTFLLECYSNQAELQQAQNAINDISLILREFRKLLPDAVFHKESVNVPLGEETVVRMPERVSTDPPRDETRVTFSANITSEASCTQSPLASLSTLTTSHNHLTSLHPNPIACTAARKSHDAKKPSISQFSESHGSRQLNANECSCRKLNISEICGGIDFPLKRRKTTVVVVSLSGFALQVDDEPRLSHFISQHFLSIAMNLADRYGGTVFSVSADKVIVVWNAFSNAPNHEKNGVQYTYDVTVSMDTFIVDIDNPALKEITPVAVATSGYVLAGTIGNEDERIMSVYGSCVTLAEELPSLLVSLGIKCACTGTLPDSCSETLYFNPVDIVSDINNNRHVVYEVTKHYFPYMDKLLSAFQLFQAGEYNSAERLYASVYEENREDRQAFRMRQICSYLRKSGHMYMRRIPEWQLFPAELEKSHEYQGRCRSYEWRNPKTSSVEDQLRSAILKKADSRPCTLDHMGANQELSLQAGFKEHGEIGIRNSSAQGSMAPNPMITEFCDRQRMMFRMSNRILGIGANGSVSVGLSQTGALVAIKNVELPMIASNRVHTMSNVNRRRLRRKGVNVQKNVEEALNSIINEISLLSRLRHPNIVGYISCAVVEKKLLLVMELACGGSLSNMLRQFAKVKVSRAKRYLSDVLKGLEYLHHKNIVHGDIKPQNVLLLENGLCKLSDFGTSRGMQKISSTARPEGTPPYIAPEAARGNPEKASDIWSFGIMMAEMLSGSYPWPDISNMMPHAFLYQVGHVETFVPQVEGDVSNVERDIIMRCCRRNASERPTARALLNEPYFCTTKGYMTPPALAVAISCISHD